MTFDCEKSGGGYCSAAAQNPVLPANNFADLRYMGRGPHHV